MTNFRRLPKTLRPFGKIEEQIAKWRSRHQKLQIPKAFQTMQPLSKNLSGKDFDGNDIDSSLFSKNAVTVMNFWFTGC